MEQQVNKLQAQLQGEKAAKKTKAQKRAQARKRRQARKREQNNAWMNEVRDDHPNQEAHPWIHSRLRRPSVQAGSLHSHILPDSNQTPENSQEQCSIPPLSSAGNDKTFLQQNLHPDQSSSNEQLSNTQSASVCDARNEIRTLPTPICTGDQLTMDNGAKEYSGGNSQIQEGPNAEKLSLEEKREKKRNILEKIGYFK